MTTTVGKSRQTEATERLSCRVNPRIKHRAEEAAQLLGQSITDFTEAALEEKAQTVFERFERITLSSRAFEVFVEAIKSPPNQPTAELVAAVADYKRLRMEEPDGNW